MANGYEDAAIQQGSTRAPRYGDRRPYKEAQARGQAVQAKRRQGDQTLRRHAYGEHITGDVQPIDDTGYRVQDNYFGPDGLQHSMGSGYEQDMREWYRNDPDPHYKIKLQDVMDQEQNRWDRWENMGPTADSRTTGDWMSADQQLEKAITDRAMGRAEREGLDFWNAPPSPVAPRQTFDAYTGAQNAALQRNAGLSDREAQLQQSFDQAIAQAKADEAERRVASTWGSLVGTPVDASPAFQPNPVQQLPADMRPLTAAPPTQADALRGQLYGPAGNAFVPAPSMEIAGRGRVQAAPPRPAPAKVQPAPTAASVGKSMGEAVAQPQTTTPKIAQTKPRTPKQKEDDKTGFVDIQRPAKQRKGYGQGRA